MSNSMYDDGPAVGRTGLLVSDFDYELPPELIAQHPLPRRDQSRMMVVERASGSFGHRGISDIAEYFRPGHVLVLNDTRVMPARLFGKIDGAPVEFLLFKEHQAGSWEALCRPAKRVVLGRRIAFEGGLEAEVEAAGEEGIRTLRFASADVRGELKRIGYAPLPPYIKRKADDRGSRSEDLERYQTVFAGREGAVAAPTAGLHFTPAMIGSLKAAGVRVVTVTLEVGLATFQPVRSETVEGHRMLEESYEVPEAAAAEINAARAEGRPVTAVGTTVVRTLESSWKDGAIRSGRGATSMFIHPGYEFKVVDRLLTNFHLPKSTLMMLVSALADRELILKAYREAVREGYRFFSYGDCMLII